MLLGISGSDDGGAHASVFLGALRQLDHASVRLMHRDREPACLSRDSEFIELRCLGGLASRLFHVLGDGFASEVSGNLARVVPARAISQYEQSQILANQDDVLVVVSMLANVGGSVGLQHEPGEDGYGFHVPAVYQSGTSRAPS